jgi:transposase-like protein
MSKEEPKRARKTGYFVHPMPVKAQAVEEYEKGLFPVREIIQKYGITRQALYNWREQVRKNGDGPMLKKRRPEELKLRVVKGILTKAFTIQEASDQYNVSKDAIIKWCSKYSYQIADVTENTVPKKRESTSVDQDRIRQLEKALEDANLKIIGLETMINIAEQDLKIDIRKKSGTKQSKS